MCSIPRLPTPGTEVPVLLTRVNLNADFGLVELWVNMDDGRKHIYEQLREEIQIPNRKFYGSEGKPGDFCLVGINDTWHRARIVSIQNESYNVFLIDERWPHIATTETLAWGNSDTFLLPPKIESCILANVFSPDNNWPERATKYLKSLPGKKFKGLVQHVLMPDRTILLDIPIVSTHMCKFGVAKKIPGDEFKCFVLRCLSLPKGDGSDVCHKMPEQNLNFSHQFEEHDQYFHPELLTGIFVTVIVTEVIGPNKIFCKLHIFSKALKLLSEEIHQYYDGSSDFEEAQPQTCGDPCAAKGRNGRWQRSLLKQTPVTSDGAAEVLHVDEGTTAVVPVGDIRPLHRKFLRMPVITYLCSLDGVKDDGTGWTTDQTDCLKSLLLNQTLMAIFDHYNRPQDVYSVRLYTANSSCINDCFMGKTGLLPPPKSEHISDVQKARFLPAFLGSLQLGQHMNSESSINADYVPEETLPSKKKPEPNDRTDNILTSAANDIPTKESSEISDALSQNGHLSAGFFYNYSTHNIEVGEKEKVWVTSAENVNHFHCQLERNSQLFEKVITNIGELVAQPQCTDHPLGLYSICLARYSDDHWYRGQIVEVSPNLKVNFVDYGNTLAVNESDIRLFPSEACVARSVPVLAIPLGLFDVPGEVPQEANQWFVHYAVDHSLTIAVVAKGTKGKLIVELFDGSLNVNMKVRERISKMAQQKMKILNQLPEHKLSNGSEKGYVPDEAFLMQEHKNERELINGTEENKICAGEELKTSSKSILVSASETEYGETLGEDRESFLETVMTETFIQGGHSNSKTTQPSHFSHPEGNVNVFKRPNISQGKTEEVYVSWIVGPHCFWCQYANTEELKKLSRVAQDEGEAPQDIMLPETLGLGSPCLAFLSSDNQWHRAQVIRRTVNHLCVLFVDYGKESEVDIKDVRSLSASLLEVAPQAFLCSLNGFDESKGSWDDSVHDDFYNLLINKQLKVTVFKMEDHAAIAVPQYAVNIESDTVVINSLMQKYWKPLLTENTKTEASQIEPVLEVGQADLNMTQLNVSTVNCLYNKPNMSRNEVVVVYASVIVDPQFFWCQYANTEDLGKVSMLAQEAGQAQQDLQFPEMLYPGSPCLALFSSDNQWYRAQVMQINGDTLHVLFIDYGNESDVDIKDVRSLPLHLLEVAPQAFLCSLNGFDDSKGSWDDQVYDDFYNLLVDKPLKLTVLNMENHSEMALPQCTVEIECEGVVVNDAMQKYWKPVSTDQPVTESFPTERLFQSDQAEANITSPKEIFYTCLYNRQKIFSTKTEEVYASCIGDPHFFWCQYAKMEDLSKVSTLAQEAGQAQQDMTVMDTLDPGSPCLALFSSDNQWYRAQVMQINGDTLHVLFIDYGNESDVDIKDVRSLPLHLLEVAPQAFLCSLNGFDGSKGSWDDQVYDDFYNLLVDKLLRVMVVKIIDNSEFSVPQYAVQVYSENVMVNDAMLKYWKPVAMEHVMTESSQRENSLQCSQTEANTTLLNSSKENGNHGIYKEPNMSKNQIEIVYASCIAEPHFFWCQYANTDDLCKVSMLAQEAGQVQQDMMFPETLGPDSPCLALFSSDNQWYRAQVLQKNGNTLHVLFIDYGNESDVDIKDVRSLPWNLLDVAPQAFLCSLNGFDGSKGSWDDHVYNDFYNLLADKPLKVTVLNVEDHAEIAVPQYAVEIECEGVVVNTMMEKYWNEPDTGHTLAEGVESVDQRESRITDQCLYEDLKSSIKKH